MNLEKEVTKNWTLEAADYSKSVREELETDLPGQWISLIQKHISLTNYKSILDVGTGPGFFPIILSKQGYQVTGIDCTQAMLDEAKKNAKLFQVSADFLMTSGNALPFQDDSFDCVISRNVTWTLLNPVESYQEWLRVLRPGGKIIIFDANWNLRYYNESLMEKHLQDNEKFRRMFDMNYSVVHVLTEEAEQYRKNTPMSKVERPQWDFNTFTNLGVKSIHCERDISHLIWGEKKQVAYHSTPMFLFVAEKK